MPVPVEEYWFKLLSLDLFLDGLLSLKYLFNVFKMVSTLGWAVSVEMTALLLCGVGWRRRKREETFG